MAENPLGAKPRSVTKCIYFPDEEQLNMLVEALKKYPRTSLSSLIVQLVDPLAAALKQCPEGSRSLKIETTIFL